MKAICFLMYSCNAVMLTWAFILFQENHNKYFEVKELNLRFAFSFQSADTSLKIFSFMGAKFFI